jgi:hypothetical protein
VKVFLQVGQRFTVNFLPDCDDLFSYSGILSRWRCQCDLAQTDFKRGNSQFESSNHRLNAIPVTQTNKGALYELDYQTWQPRQTLKG